MLKAMSSPYNLGACAMLLMAVPAQGQQADGIGELGFAPHVGTLGLGVDVAVTVHRQVGLRGGINWLPFDINVEHESVDYELDWSSPHVPLLVDFYPSGQFRLSGGVLFSPSTYDVTGRLAEATDVGDNVYTPQEVGTLRGEVSTNTTSPYVGIGYGNPAAGALGFFFDLGVAFHGNPAIAVTADGTAAADPQFQADLDAEVVELEDDLESWVVYPVLSIGLSFGLGG